jgi:GH25 family lysozyme M1 (1,4-beta-N-acetylmuramidase)
MAEEPIKPAPVQPVQPVAVANKPGQTKPQVKLPLIHMSGIDTNKYNPLHQLDFDNNPNRLSFVFARAVTRATNPDGSRGFATEKTFAGDVQLARKNGVPIGGYHFVVPGADTVADTVASGKAQAKYLIDAINSVGGLKPGDLPPVLDLERAPKNVKTDYWYKLTPEQRILFVNTMSSEVEKALGVKPIIYTQESFVKEFFTSSAVMAQVKDKATYQQQLKQLGTHALWEVNINGKPKVPAPFTTAVFSQVSFGEQKNYREVPLQNGNAKKDQDIFNGNLGQLLNQTYQADKLEFKLGDRGVIVANLQMQLKKAGFYNGPIGVNQNAVINEATVEAIKQYQASKAIMPTGIINQRTWNSLFNVNQSQNQQQNQPQARVVR